ncbi:MAG: transglutaminase family protein [Myxococcota bacterium]
MAIRVALHHRTTYRYDRRVGLSPQIVRLRPAVHTRTPIESYALRISPSNHFLNWQQDAFGNFQARLVFPERVDHLEVEVDLIASISIINPFDFFLEPEAEHFPFAYGAAEARDLRPFLEQSDEDGPLLRAFVESVDLAPKPTVQFLVELNQRLHAEVAYLIRMEPGVQRCEETLALRSGSCRDSAWLLVQILRRLGLGARFVSGYLIQLTPDVKSLDGPSGTDRDFTDLHAWAEVYLPGAGWVGLDPTSGLLAGEGHVPLAASPDPAGAAPLTGGVDECQVEFEHAMSVARIHGDPRVTKPYSEADWRRIDALGERVDDRLAADDVRLTLGGEPTFVSIDDMEGAEWNGAAVGPTKHRLAADLLRRLRRRFAPGGVLHFGQGKWYPGESLPRWAYTCFWRADGAPLWQDERWIAEPGAALGHGPDDAQRFAEALAETLGVERHLAMPAFEDATDALAREGRLPINVDPTDSRLEDPEERDRMRRVFERGLSTPAGCVLPIQRASGRDGRVWQSGLWWLRGKHLVLIPGDSPMGLRLPLPSLPWVAPGSTPTFFPLDPLAERGPLPQPGVRSIRGGRTQPRLASPSMDDPGDAFARARARVVEQTLPDRQPAVGESADWVVRTALCVEPRDGVLRVFMPPLESADDFVELVAAIEATAAALALPVALEGYTPPEDPRLLRFSITPDPGVIEVNVHPSHAWRELVERTESIYEEARQARLGTEKFQLDGRHTGTGGGNHVVLGGPTPADSPLLRRPDLLRSLVGYWINHPALSYLFSGLFVGPTSQAPRVDEGRADALYELEIAFAQVPDPGERPAAPWLVDRIFRNLLVDVTGNTHRAEFCIDKLYPPEQGGRRLGLLELRAFEMPPHPRMSLVQQLLLRALVARFWRAPYCEPLVGWGTRLHDRFLLPRFVEADLREVLRELALAGFDFDPAWFAPHLEFRFPRFGAIHYRGIALELRQAIEPWYVLGEEPAAGGTVRFVDSSVERLEVSVSGFDPERYAVVCNGRRVPLAATGVEGELVAGVRYRAWQPPSCLHPTIPVHTPLVFDLIDRWNDRAVSGCRLHVAHPGGRNYEVFPVNAYEAEARRSARFSPFGHSPGTMAVPPVEENPSFPTTLDLRRSPR